MQNLGTLVGLSENVYNIMTCVLIFDTQQSTMKILVDLLAVLIHRLSASLVDLERSANAHLPSVTCLQQHKLTPCSRILLQKLTVTQLVKKSPSFYGTRRFIIVFRKPNRWSLTSDRCIQSTPSHPISLRIIPIYV
jgi:hypothetical protein